MKYTFMIVVLAALALAIVIASFTKIELSNEGYDRLKALVMKWHGIVTFLGVLVSTFAFDMGEETLTVVAALGAFLAYVLGASDKSYKGGSGIDYMEDEHENDNI